MPHTPRHPAFDDDDFVPGGVSEDSGSGIPVKTGSGTIGASSTGYTGNLTALQREADKYVATSGQEGSSPLITPPPPPPPPPPEEEVAVIPPPEVIDPKLTSALDVQANPLPSLPSISNIGSVPFTGTVSTIPGGFQPLPQVAGGRKKLYQLSKFHGGINQKSSPRDIADFECQEATNVTVSQIGRITTLGDIKGTDNSITTHAIGTADRGSAGYGLFQFTAPAAIDATAGEYVITLAPDGDRIDAFDSTGTAAFIDYAGSADNHDVAHVIYAAGNGVYANDANFGNASSNNPRKAKIYVYRKDLNAEETVSGWVEGLPLITSPDKGTSTADVVLELSDAVTITRETSAGSMTVMTYDNDAAGLWNGTYHFYVSWIFDGGCETGLSFLGSDAPANEQLELNISFLHTNSAPLGGDKRIEGARIYFKKDKSAERFLLAELSLVDGIKGALDSTYLQLVETATDTWGLAEDGSDNIVFDAPPEVYTYASLNGYYANEAYSVSPDAVDTAPTALEVRYKTAVVGSGGIVFIGNVKFNGKHMPDSMMFSMPGKPGVFPKFNRFDSPSSDGSPITALAAYKDTILQFKENGMYIINVSNPSQFYAQASYRDCGVLNPCQVFITSFGVIFANKNGCYIYDGQKVTSLTDGKFNFADWDLPTVITAIGNDGAGVPCVGYDPRSQSIIVLKDINDDATDTKAWIYNMVTQSWTEGNEMITNANTNRHTNFIITSGGYLSILRDDNTSVTNYKQSNNAQKVVFQTKDLDFGLPSQTKKLFKVYITYKGNASNLVATWRINGSATDYGFTATNWADDSGTTDNEIATLVPDDAAEATGWQSMSIYITSESNTVATSFEINDISILYRARPIK